MNTICNTTFGTWFLSELERRGLSQRDFAHVSGISESGVSQIISGKRNVGAKILASIARTLDLSVDFVFEKAGLLPPNGLSPAKYTLIDLVRQLPDSDVEALITLVKPEHEHTL